MNGSNGEQPLRPQAPRHEHTQVNEQRCPAPSMAPPGRAGILPFGAAPACGWSLGRPPGHPRPIWVCARVKATASACGDSPPPARAPLAGRVSEELEHGDRPGPALACPRARRLSPPVECALHGALPPPPSWRLSVPPAPGGVGLPVLEAV